MPSRLALQKRLFFFPLDLLFSFVFFFFFDFEIMSSLPPVIFGFTFFDCVLSSSVSSLLRSRRAFLDGLLSPPPSVL